jgi:hypothetical protein
MTMDDRWKMGLRARQYVERHYAFATLAIRFEKVLQSALEDRRGEARSETEGVHTGTKAA